MINTGYLKPFYNMIGSFQKFTKIIIPTLPGILTAILSIISTIFINRTYTVFY